MKQNVIYICYQLLYFYHVIRAYLMQNRVICVCIAFVMECYNSMYRMYYSIRDEPDCPQWTNVSFVVRKYNGSPTLDEAYQTTPPIHEDKSYPIYLSPYPVVSDILLVYKQNDSHYSYKTVPTFWQFLKDTKPNIVDISMTLVPTKVEILSVEYATGKITLEIDVPEHDRMVGNTILSMAYIARYLSYTYGTKYPLTCLPSYTVTVMIMTHGMDIETIQISPSQGLLLHKDSYEIVNT